MTIFITAIEAGAGAYIGWQAAKSVNDFLSDVFSRWSYRRIDR